MLIFLIIAAAVLLVLGAWLWLVAPKKTSGMEEFKCVYYAHRGLHGECGGGAAENSISAFARAVEAGYGIELDIRLSADGEVVAFHDDDLLRMTGVDKKVSELTAAELAELSLLGTGDGVPTFREVLSLVDGKAPLLVELKEMGSDLTLARRAAELLREYSGSYVIESFNPLTLGEIKRILPGAERGFLLDKHTANPKYRTTKFRIVERCLLNFIARPTFLSVEKKRIGLMPVPLLRALFRVPTIAWTVTSEEEEGLARRQGFDGVIFEQYIPKKD